MKFTILFYFFFWNSVSVPSCFCQTHRKLWIWFWLVFIFRENYPINTEIITPFLHNFVTTRIDNVVSLQNYAAHSQKASTVKIMKIFAKMSKQEVCCTWKLLLSFSEYLDNNKNIFYTMTRLFQQSKCGKEKSAQVCTLMSPPLHNNIIIWAKYTIYYKVEWLMKIG